MRIDNDLDGAVVSALALVVPGGYGPELLENNSNGPTLSCRRRGQQQQRSNAAVPTTATVQRCRAPARPPGVPVTITQLPQYALVMEAPPLRIFVAMPGTRPAEPVDGLHPPQLPDAVAADRIHRRTRRGTLPHRVAEHARDSHRSQPGRRLRDHPDRPTLRPASRRHPAQHVQDAALAALAAAAAARAA